MEIVVYADETIRPANRKRKATYEGTIGLAGFMAERSEWDNFCLQWAATLGEFHVDFFHFRELNPERRSKPKTPYSGWKNDKTDDFIFSLAKVISDTGIVPFGSDVFPATPGQKHYRPDTWRQAADLFFADFLERMDLHHGSYKDPARFVFDHQENGSIVGQIYDSAQVFRKSDRRIGGLSFEPESKPESRPAPLQAADMLVYALGQIAERAFVVEQRQNMRILDALLFKNVYPKGHPNSLPWYINESMWHYMLQDCRRDKKDFDAMRKAAGLPKTEYFPQKHYGNSIDRTKI